MSLPLKVHEPDKHFQAQSIRLNIKIHNFVKNAMTCLKVGLSLTKINNDWYNHHEDVSQNKDLFLKNVFVYKKLYKM